MNLGERIKQLRKERHLSQEALAQELQLSRQATAKWENGTSQPSTAHLIALCRIFGISMAEFTAVEQEGKPLSKPHKMPKLLLYCSIFMVLLSVIVFGIDRRHRLPDNLIGYADQETAIIVSGTSGYQYLLYGITILFIIATCYIFWRRYAKNKGDKR